MLSFLFNGLMAACVFVLLQERVVIKEPPSVYLAKLRHLIDPKLLSGKAKSSLTKVQCMAWSVVNSSPHRRSS